MTLKLHLIGPIPKGDDVRRNWKDWKIEYTEKLSRIRDIVLTDGDVWRDETKPLQLVGHDTYLLRTADIIIVNAEEMLGVGTAQEMVIAKYFSKPVITILPKDAHHRKSNIVFNGTKIDDWIHPFVLAFSDLVVENVDDCLEWIEVFRRNPETKEIKDITILDNAISSYLNEKGGFKR
ncbi:MAG: hypothetical protein KKA90_03275 [Nanoarchaeota archaeon]|nr:hypothetical protein [Nanoarchaeota archaeon]